MPSQNSNTPVAWMWEQAQYPEGDLRGRCWDYRQFGTQKPDTPWMQRNVTPLYAFPPDAAAEVERLKVELAAEREEVSSCQEELRLCQQDAITLQAELTTLRNAATQPDMVPCRHEAYNGACVHCNAPFVNGRVVLAASEGERK